MFGNVDKERIPKCFFTKQPKGNSDPGDLGDDSSTSETADIMLSKEDLQLRAKIDEAWPLGIVAQLDLNASGRNLEWRTVIVCARHDKIELVFSDVFVHDGEAELWVAPKWLGRLEVASKLGPRMVAHAHATTSPRCNVFQGYFSLFEIGSFLLVFHRLVWQKLSFPIPSLHT